jgi:hypothetical protein
MLLERKEYFLLKRGRPLSKNAALLFERVPVLFKRAEALSFSGAAHFFRSPVRFFPLP